MTAGQKLKTWRKTKGVTQRAVADRLGRDPSYVSHWEAGDWRPNGDERRALEVITSGAVKETDWLTDDERTRYALLQNAEPIEGPSSPDAA